VVRQDPLLKVTEEPTEIVLRMAGSRDERE
jgi:hypothetical protein